MKDIYPTLIQLSKQFHAGLLVYSNYSPIPMCFQMQMSFQMGQAEGTILLTLSLSSSFGLKPNIHWGMCGDNDNIFHLLYTFFWQMYEQFVNYT